ncbi:MAG: helix-turn-helix domain-containing protein, partial [Acidobacteriaceae bacterium]
VRQRMLEYDWPGNIRELENLCKRFVLVGSETQILRELSSRNGAKVLPVNPAMVAQPMHSEPAAATPAGVDSSLSLLEVGRRAAWKAERCAIVGMLETTHWNRREAARRLQVSYKALLNKIKQMQMEDAAQGGEQGERFGKITTQ